jgi:addiction module HigA family antidote
MARSPDEKKPQTSIPRDFLRRPPPIHPGEMLREEFLLPLNLSANALAIALRVPVTRISEILKERRGITADTAYRLALYFGTSPDFWMNMQIHYELSLVHNKSFKQIRKEVRPREQQQPR